MPVYDFYCNPEGENDGCGHLIENEVFTFEEFDTIKAAGGLPCPNCPGMMQTKPGRVAVQFGKVVGETGKLYPGSKRERRQMMEGRYKKRNNRLDKMPEVYKRRMSKFFDRFGIRKTAPAGPEFA